MSLEDPIKRARNNLHYRTRESSETNSPIRNAKKSSMSTHNHVSVQQYEDVKLPYPMRQPLLRKRIIA